MLCASNQKGINHTLPHEAIALELFLSLTFEASLKITFHNNIKENKDSDED